MRGFISFLFSVSFLKNLVLAIIVGFALILLGLKATDYYTYHGERIAVPNLSGKTISEAKTLLSTNKLSCVVQDSVFSRKAKPGSVLDQFPRSGQEVKRGRIVKLTIAALAPQKVIIEQVKDLALRQAIGQLRKKGIRIKNLEYVESAYTNLVLGISYNGKELERGQEIYKYEEVTLIVGKKKYDVLVMPNLLGLSASYAKRKALEEGVNVRNLVFKDSSVKGKKVSRVVRQSIRPGETVTLGRQIDLILAEPETN